MILKTKLFGHVYEFKSLKEVMAKANEEKSGSTGLRILRLRPHRRGLLQRLCFLM